MKTRTKVGLGVVAPLVLTGVIGAIALSSINQITYTAGWVDHTRKVLAQGSNIVTSAVDMETGMRGYLLAGKEEFLEPYNGGEKAFYERVAALKETVSDNPGQVARLGEVEGVIREWQAKVTEPTIELRREIGDAPTMDNMADLVGEARGKTYFDKFRGQIATFIGREETLLEQRQATFAQQLSAGVVDTAQMREAVNWVTHTYKVIGEANAILTSAIDMETGMRGYLLAGKEEFLEPLNGGRERFYAKIAALKTTVSDNPPQVALLGEIETTITEWLDEVVKPTIDLRREIGDAKTMNDMATLVGEARGKAYFDKFRGLMADFAEEERGLMVERQAANVATENWAFWSILGSLIGAMIIGAFAALKIGSSIANPINAISAAMRRLVDGDTDVEIVGADRGDEVGDIAKATQIFKENAIRVKELAEAEQAEQAAAAKRQAAMNELQSSIREVVASASRGEFGNRIEAEFEERELSELAEGVNGLLKSVDEGLLETTRVVSGMASGDLDLQMTGAFQGAFAELQSNVNATVDRLSQLVGEITATTRAVRDSAGSISDSSQDLSHRATEQASSLEETAATMEEMSASITTNADSSKNASSLAGEASKLAGSGGEIVKSAVSAMNDIEQSASKIADIISVIDGIAFQTNLLALNAAVEAARAGDAGKGFAVVASEVRALAQRSSDASRDIRQLIELSASQVSQGVELVTQTGASLEGIVGSIVQVEEAVRDIADASKQQAAGVQEVTSTISNMDEMTQQNSSMAEASASNAQSLVGSAEKLQELIAFFKIAGELETAKDGEWRAAAAAAPQPKAGAAAAAGDNAGAWSQF